MQTTQGLQRAAREYRAVADRHEANGRHRLARNFRAHAADCDRRAEELRPKTGTEFAKAHGNDSSTWTAADFESELVFAEADAQVAYAFIQARLSAKTATPQLTPAA
ncbi:hypothetical protein [Streptomyces sp. NPDC001492]